MFSAIPLNDDDSKNFPTTIFFKLSTFNQKSNSEFYEIY